MIYYCQANRFSPTY